MQQIVDEQKELLKTMNEDAAYELCNAIFVEKLSALDIKDFYENYFDQYNIKEGKIYFHVKKIGNKKILQYFVKNTRRVIVFGKLTVANLGEFYESIKEKASFKKSLNETEMSRIVNILIKREHVKQLTSLRTEALRYLLGTTNKKHRKLFYEKSDCIEEIMTIEEEIKQEMAEIIALNLLKAGLDTKFVAKNTKIKIKTIQALQEIIHVRSSEHQK